MATRKTKQDSGNPTSPTSGFQRVALLLQGGGALGSYQAGVYQAMTEAGVQPDCVAGVSIGSINAALIAGNAPEDRVTALRTFWDKVTSPPPGLPSMFATMIGAMGVGGDQFHALLNQTRAFATMAGGAPDFFTPRPVPPSLTGDLPPDAASYYDVTPLRATLLNLVDFDRINSKETRYCAGAVNIRNGNFEYFDSEHQKIGVEHIMASGALPPGFPAVQIGDEFYWDGGLISNTPLQWVLGTKPREDTLAFQVDLWSARGEVPRTMAGIDQRAKEIRFSSRTRASTDQFKTIQHARRALARVLDMLPDRSILDNDPELRALASAADDKVYNIVHLIYRTQTYEGASADYEFSRATMTEHWMAGHRDATETLKHPQIFQRPETSHGVATFDLS
jgi:NTE family protein